MPWSWSLQNVPLAGCSTLVQVQCEAAERAGGGAAARRTAATTRNEWHIVKVYRAVVVVVDGANRMINRASVGLARGSRYVRVRCARQPGAPTPRARPGRAARARENVYKPENAYPARARAVSH